MSGVVADLAQRSDAQRNRRLLLEAAAAAFAERGIDVPAEEIARRAGVAKGTLFRHFPAKEDLVAAAPELSDRIAQVRQLVGEIAARPEIPLTAIAELMERAAELIAADRSFFDAAMHEAELRPALHADRLAFERELGALLARAQAGGHVRGDVVGADIAMLIAAATNVCAPVHNLRPDLWRRYIALMVDALRPGETTALNVPSLEITAP
jgi:AcrR family transcriptional regulator